MDFSLERARQKTALLIVTFALSAVVIFQATEIWLADHQIHSNNGDQMERGAALLPGDGHAWDLLGHYYQWDFLHSDLPRALADYQHAVRDNPWSADYWMDVASASEASGDEAGAERAFERAQAVYPSSGEVAFHYGNFLLRQQEYPEAYAQLRRAVVADRALLPVVISRVWRSSEDVNQLLDQALPPDIDAYSQALDFFGSIHQAEPALAVWQRMRKLGRFIPLQQTFPLMDELIREDRAEDARRVWSEALAMAGLPNQEPARESRIWDGSFGTDFANGGLGWRWDSPPGASIDFDFQAGPNGSRVVRLDFTGGENVNLDAPFQYVPVEPNHRYHFHAALRTEDITTESGMRFELVDPHHAGAVDVVSDNFTGSQPWTPINEDVSTGAGTHFLLVRLVRPPSRLFDSKLSGRAWIADVSLIPSDVPADAAGETRSR
jgi:tetratricopeptide (TPR) repeat protein